MNKDVIYIEPEDDITDIITKIEKSKEKIVALVPPKKAGVFRSVVNIKLINKAGKGAEKTIVLVTTDPSIVKLAAATRLPVTKDLQTAPVIPKEDDVEDLDTVSKEDLVEKEDGEVESEDEDSEGDEEESDSKDEEDEEEEDKEEDEDEEEEKETKKPVKAAVKKTSKAAKKINNKFLAWFIQNKKLAIGCGVGGILLIILLIWALVIAPAVTVTVSIRAKSDPFSQAVSFVTKLEDEDAEKGIFYLEEKKVEDIQEIKFEATGKKNVGAKAKGEVVIYHYFPILKRGGKIPISKGATFTIGDLTYVATEDVLLMWDGDLGSISKDCENFGDETIYGAGCLVSGRVSVEATAPGTKYNIEKAENGWSPVADVKVYSDKAMTGGTDEYITIVQQSDIDQAKSKLSEANLAENKEKLFEKITDDMLAIESSLKQETGEAISTPAVGEEVKEGTEPILKATTTTSIFVLDKTKLEEFIRAKTKLEENQKFYVINNPFVENFVKTDNGYTGKLKTSYLTGPEITVESIVEMIKGRGIGDAKHILKDINGVSEVKIDGSLPWVTGVPNDSNKITVNLEVKDQTGNKVEEKTDITDKDDEESADESSENKEEESEEKSDKQSN